MSKYPATKILKSAIPTVDNTTGKVKKWEIEVIFKHKKSDNTSWSRAYSHTEDVAYLDKTPENFSKNELLQFMNSNMDDIFDAHYEAHNIPSKEDRVSDFSINSLQ